MVIKKNKKKPVKDLKSAGQRADVLVAAFKEECGGIEGMVGMGRVLTVVGIRERKQMQGGQRKQREGQT